MLSLGISVLDYSVVLDAFPKPDSKQVAEKQVAGGGGNAANTSVCVSRLGVPAGLMSKVGDDPAGLTLLRQLNDEGVRCEGTVQVATADGSDGSTVTCFVLVAGDTRTIVSMPYSQRVSDLDPDWAEAQVRPLLDSSSVSMLQLDGRHPDAGARCAALARSKGVPVLVEAELRSAKMMSKQGAQLAALLSTADYIVTSEDYPRAATGIGKHKHPAVACDV